MAAAVMIIPWLDSCRNQSIVAGLDRPDFISHALDRTMMTNIGKAYLKSFPDENTPNGLSDLLMKNHPGKDQMDPDSLKTYFKQEIASDFLNERMVVVSGWVLSRTEARQCALFTLTHP